MRAQRRYIFILAIFGLLWNCLAKADSAANANQVSVAEGTLDMPTYVPAGREMEPALFHNSSVIGLYPFPSFLTSFTADSPVQHTYKTVIVENEYLKLTYLPEFGGRFFSLYDKIHKKEAFYRNDIVKPTMFNPRQSWSLFGLELTGPFDAHTLTLNGEPFWSHTIVRHEDGSVSLVLGEIDPIYHMKVNLTATIYPGVAAMQISVFCYNRNDGRMPQMFWTSGSMPSTEKTRFIYPMTRTIGHTSGEVSDWPLYNNIDYSWDRNNTHMLGVFGIDTYDNFAGAYQFENDYGVFRYADRRLVQGMKIWTFGYSATSDNMMKVYTQHGEPYIEIQSGRNVWDGHYEYVAPHKVENWSEWWVPVAGIGGLTTMTRDVALNLTVTPDSSTANTQITVSLSPVCTHKSAKLIVSSAAGEILNTSVDLVPGTPVTKTVSGINAGADGLKELLVRIVDGSGREILNYRRPDDNPGRKQYSVYAKALEHPQKNTDQMSAEELVKAAEFKLKETNSAAMLDLVALALKKDPDYSQAHLLLGEFHYNGGRYQQAVDELNQATSRDPYLDEGWYYLAVSQLALGDIQSAERNFYYISPQSSYNDEREYQLGRLDVLAGQYRTAEGHLLKAITSNGSDLNARALLATCYRELGQKEKARLQLDEVERIDPTNRIVYTERYFMNGDPNAREELLRLTGGQSQEATDVAIFYESIHHWREAIEVLSVIEKNNKDPWSTSPVFYYTLSYDLRQSGNSTSADEYIKKARAASSFVDRFPSRRESEAPLAEAVRLNPHDEVARFFLGCLLYSLERPNEAIAQWTAAAETDSHYFSARRALGLALAEQGKVDAGIEQLAKAVELRPEHARTLNDLSTLYASVGRFDEQIALLHKALLRSANDDDLETALLNAYLIKGSYKEADQIVSTYKFAPRHRYYVLRDIYRNLRYGMGAVAFNKGDYAQALEFFQSALKPPVSLGVDDFQSQSSPRAHYYIGRTFEALGRKDEAMAEYEASTHGVEQLTGDRDSWNSDSFYMVLSLDRLGKQDQANSLIPHFDGFARTEMDESNPVHRGQARYLLALIAKRDGKNEQARTLTTESIQALPNYLQPRYDLRGDAIASVTTLPNHQ